MLCVTCLTGTSDDVILAVDQYRVYWLAPGSVEMSSVNKLSGDELVQHILPQPVRHIQAYNSLTQPLPGTVRGSITA